MKYPQLVSTRAVSAISDWLVTQLEQLGVDASSVYSRLLLSLLHTPLQINALDLAEISDNKVANCIRNKSLHLKSGNGSNYRRFSAADTEALKRLAAIDSLLEAVPSDQQLSKIESLVDELSLKLREIEEQNGLEDSVFEIGQSDTNALCNSKIDPIEKKTEASEDPAKRYFNAFPALSDQSKNEYTHKTTSWPKVNNKVQSGPQSDDPSSSAGAVATKKKTKRRRVNSTMSTVTNAMDSKAAHTAAPSKNASSSTKVRPVTSKTNPKKKSSEIWDTDFDGAWEMGRDLIREFVLKQNNRNRSISESNPRFTSLEADAIARNASDQIDLQMAKDTSKRCTDLDNDEENLMRVAAAATSALFGKNFDLNLYGLNVPDSETVSLSSHITDSSLLLSNNEKVIQSEGYSTPDTLASWNDIEVPRRDQESLVFGEMSKGYGIDTGSDCVDSGCDENNCVAAFEAKFDRNVEALWDDCKDDTPKTESQVNRSFWFDYDNNIDKQSRPPITDQFKQFFQLNQAAVFPNNGIGCNDRNLFAAAQPNSLSSNSSSTIGGMNLTSSIWTDNPNNNEDDVSFYANARLWEMNQAKSSGQKFNLYSNESATTLQSSNKPISAASNYDIGNYESSHFSKWSDTEVPILPDGRMSPQHKKDEKIRKNLFGNSYFCNYQSTQSMSNSNGLIAKTDPSTEYPFSQTKSVQKRKVTLVNHSSSSCFKEVEPLSFEAKQEILCKNKARKYHVDDEDDQEDLLTSEKSRFQPINQTYVDGYSFDISNKLDHINYERSSSGMLFHNSEVYREYYVYDDDGNGGNRRDADGEPEFTLKYCLRQNDKGCQTDDSLPNSGVFTANVLPLLNATGHNRIQSVSSLSVNSLASQSRPYFQSQLSGADYDKNYAAYDKMVESSQDSWCLAESRSCCNNNNSGHALWEHCATCSTDVISMPANTRLKDELIADGDEIMSDLKYLIQSISFSNDWEDSDSMADCDDEDVVVQVKTDANRNVLTDVNKLIEYDNNMSDANDDFSSNHMYSNVSKLISDLLQPEKAQTLVQAISEKCQGRLIANENSSNDAKPKKRIHDTKDVQAKNEMPCNSATQLSGHFGSLSAYNDNSIWRKEPPAEIEQNPDEKSPHRVGEQWEHANLQKIWSSMVSDASQDVCMADSPISTATEQTISGERCTSHGERTSLAPMQSEKNTLEKFMDLIKQANTNGRCSGPGSHTKNHNERCIKNISRYDRKRRHSATSQNYFDQLNCALNCDAIESIKKLATKTVDEYDATNIFNCDANKKPTTTAIITCKYLTACDSFCLTSTLAFNNNYVGDNDHILSCYHDQQHHSKYHPDKIMNTLNGNDSLLMQPSTFLKQVAAMVSRPLTR